MRDRGGEREGERESEREREREILAVRLLTGALFKSMAYAESV